MSVVSSHVLRAAATVSTGQKGMTGQGIRKFFPKCMCLVASMLLALGCVVLAAPWTSKAQDYHLSEYQLKAAFIYNFVKFVEWPSNAFQRASAPFVIGVLGDDPFAGNLKKTVQNKSTHGHDFLVKSVTSVEEAKTCQILFICNSESDRLTSILAALHDTPTLTVGETESFTEDGGVIRFIRLANKVRFEINDAQARKVGLKISAKLLNLAVHPNR